MLELFDAELKELGPQLRLGHAVGDVFLVPPRLVVVELEPKTHNLVVEVRAWLYKFYVQVLGRFARGRLRHLDLLLNYVLLLSLQFVDKVVCQL